MILYEELYFDINVTGPKSEIKKFVSYLRSGELDEFFEFTTDYVIYNDNFDTAEINDETGVTLSTDDYGIEIDEFHTDEFLEILCKAGKQLYIKGQLYDADNEEYSFISEVGDSYYINALLVNDFNEDEDKPHEEEDEEE